MEIDDKLKRLEQEKQSLSKKVEEKSKIFDLLFSKDEMINFIKQENETLNEQYYNLDAKLKDTQRVKNNIIKSMNTEVKSMFEGILNSIDRGNLEKSSKDISGIYKYIFDLVHNIQEYKDPVDLNSDSHNNSNINNFFEEDQKKSSYITQNYEKFKQQEQKEKNSVFNMSSGKQNAKSGTSSNNSSFVGIKSNIYQNLVNKTPNKQADKSFHQVESHRGHSQSGSGYFGVPGNQQPHVNSMNNLNNLQASYQLGHPSKSFNPNPLTSHLPKQNNDKFVNKFISNKK